MKYFLENLNNNGKNYGKFLEEVMMFLKDLILFKKNVSSKLIKTDSSYLEKVGSMYSLNDIFYIIDIINQLVDKIKFVSRQSIVVISNFLLMAHKFNNDDKENVLEEYQLLKNTIYNSLSDIEKQYIESFMNRFKSTDIFDGKKCLCHNDFSCNHLLLDENNKLCGIIDFGDAGIIDEYCDFIYLLEDSEEEIGQDFGLEILKLYGNIDIEKAKEYQDIVEQYYPIETIIYGIKNNKQEYINKGKQEILNRLYYISQEK